MDFDWIRRKHFLSLLLYFTITISCTKTQSLLGVLHMYNSQQKPLCFFVVVVFFVKKFTALQATRVGCPGLKPAGTNMLVAKGTSVISRALGDLGTSVFHMPSCLCIRHGYLHLTCEVRL